ncbi:MAG: GDP-mannose 4,6-dehydratase [Nitrosopumilus sp.]|nr:GDP-mannose 4,6-dehydratase [Nitrosopumilus sp.]MDH3832646.1 GDP-mannose 4,6-dehydratase [Nitrosopumilus sp.]
MKQNKKTILVTGSNGFIGSHLLKTLLKKYKVIGVNHTQDTKTKNYSPLRKNIVKLSVDEISEKLGGVIHLAAITDVDLCDKNPKKCFLTNIMGTQKALEIARKNNCKFVYISTNHVYGKPKKLPISENHPRNPNSIYATSKLAAEICCEGYSKSYDMDIDIVRLFSVYGPKSPPHLVTSKIITQLQKKNLILGNVSSQRDFIYISDVINAIKIVFEKSSGFNVYNIGTGKCYSILNICNLLKNLSKSDVPVRTLTSKIRRNDVKKILSNNTKIKKLGWEPQVNLELGLKMTLDWYNSQKTS